MRPLARLKALSDDPVGTVTLIRPITNIVITWAMCSYVVAFTVLLFTASFGDQVIKVGLTAIGVLSLIWLPIMLWLARKDTWILRSRLTFRLMDVPTVGFPIAHPSEWRTLIRAHARLQVVIFCVGTVLFWGYPLLFVGLSFGYILHISTKGAWGNGLLVATLLPSVLICALLVRTVYRGSQIEYRNALENVSPPALSKVAQLREQFESITQVVLDASRLSDELGSMIGSQQQRLTALIDEYQNEHQLSTLTKEQTAAVVGQLTKDTAKVARRERIVNIIVAIMGTMAGYIISQLAPFAEFFKNGH